MMETEHFRKCSSSLYSYEVQVEWTDSWHEAKKNGLEELSRNWVGLGVEDSFKYHDLLLDIATILRTQ